MLSITLAFFAGLFLANGIPHFVTGVSAREFTNPLVERVRKVLPGAPVPLVNVCWGMLNFGLAWFLLSRTTDAVFGRPLVTLAFCVGFGAASIGLSLFLHAYAQRSQ